MIKSAKLGKLTVAVSSKDIGVLLHYLASQHMAEIKDISELPKEWEVLEDEFEELDEEVQDISLKEFKFRMMEKKIAEIGEHLDYIMKKLDISPKGNIKKIYEFHVKDLEDLVDKMLDTVNEVYYKVQENFNSQVENARERSQLSKEMTILESFAYFDFNRSMLEGFRFIGIKMVIVTRNNLGLFRNFLEKNKFFYNELKLTEDDSFFIIPHALPDRETLEEGIDLYNGREFELKDEYFTPDGSIDYDGIKTRYQALVKRERELVQELRQLKEDYLVELVALREVHRNAYNFLKYHEKMHFTTNFVIAEFWVVDEEWPVLEKNLKKIFRNKIRYHYEPVEPTALYEEETGEAEEEEKPESETPPTLIKVPKLLKPYMLIINLYGLPRYSEINPLIFVFFSFPILFGLMFGDIGQGIGLLVGGLVMTRVFKHRQGWRSFGYIIAYCGIGAIIAGFIYGEVFGLEFEFWIFPIYRPFEGDAMDVFVMTIWVGCIQITVGFLIRSYNYIHIKKPYLVVSNSLPKIVLLWSFWLVIQERGLRMNYYLSPDFFQSIYGILIISCLLLLLFGKLVGKLARISYLRKQGSLGLLGRQSMDIFESILSFLSNALSYTRIFAMTMVHLGFMLAVRLIADQIVKMLGSPLLWPIFYAIGNVLVILLELLLVTIQNVRLHFYEFFSKFYEGGGKEFTPIKYDVRFSKIYFDDSKVFLVEKASVPALTPRLDANQTNSPAS